VLPQPSATWCGAGHADDRAVQGHVARVDHRLRGSDQGRADRQQREIKPFELYLFIAVVYFVFTYSMSLFARRSSDACFVVRSESAAAAWGRRGSDEPRGTRPLLLGAGPIRARDSRSRLPGTGSLDPRRPHARRAGPPTTAIVTRQPRILCDVGRGARDAAGPRREARVDRRLSVA